MLLKNLVNIKGGKRLPKGKMLTSFANDHPYIKVKDMKEYITELNNNFEYVPDNVFHLIKQYTTNTNDILLSIVGTIGNVTIVGNSLNNASLTENCVKLIVKNNDICINKYLYYFFKSKKGKQLINNGIVGSTQPKLPLYNIENFEIPTPSLSTQQHIVDTIGSVDDLIEKNEEIIEKLKLFRQTYFNNFYNISKNNGEINLKDIIVVEGGSQPPKSEHIYEYKKGYIRFIQNRDYNSNSHITYIKESSKNKICNKYDIMIDKYGEAGTIRYGLEGAYNVALSKITVTKEYYTEFVRDFLMQKSIKDLLNNSCQASTRASLNESTFIGIKIPNISVNLIKKYEEDMRILLKMELKVIDKNKSLTIIKNNLLSKYFD